MTMTTRMALGGTILTTGIVLLVLKEMGVWSTPRLLEKHKVETSLMIVGAAMILADPKFGSLLGGIGSLT